MRNIKPHLSALSPHLRTATGISIGTTMSRAFVLSSQGSGLLCGWVYYRTLSQLAKRRLNKRLTFPHLGSCMVHVTSGGRYNRDVGLGFADVHNLRFPRL